VKVDDRSGASYDGYEENSLAVGPTGGRIVYVVRKGHGAHAVIDETLGPGFDLVHDPVLSPDGKRVAYVGQTSETMTLMVDGTPVVSERMVSESRPVFSADGRRIAVLARRGAEWFAIVDGTPGPAYESIHVGTLVATGSGFEYLAVRAGSLYRVVVD
jgi:Tol biopolymer transport system component